jgi:hypothetical protein
MREKRFLQERRSSARVALNAIDGIHFIGKKKRPQEARPKRRTERRPPSMMNSDKIEYCNQCKQPVTEIDNYGERLIGCLTEQQA